MKKFLLVICTLAIASSIASAAVGVTWTTVNWGEMHGGDGSGTGPAILDNNSVLWQLIYAGVDNVIDPIPNPVAAAPGPMTAYGDDQVWAYRTIAQGGGTASQDGTVWDNWLALSIGDTMYVNTEWTTAGYVYQRIFENSAPENGTYYFETGLTALNTLYSDSDPTSVTATYPDETSPFVPNQQVTVIPEPATMSLLGLGALVMAIRRRRA